MKLDKLEHVLGKEEEISDLRKNIEEFMTVTN